MNSRHVYVLLRKPTCRKRAEELSSFDLYCVSKIPVTELADTEPTAVARFLIEDSFTPAWARVHRRPLKAGDGFWMGGTTYLLCRITDGRRFTLYSTNEIDIRKVLSG